MVSFIALRKMFPVTMFRRMGGPQTWMRWQVTIVKCKAIPVTHCESFRAVRF
jgi:hypothetical protein